MSCHSREPQAGVQTRRNKLRGMYPPENRSVAYYNTRVGQTVDLDTQLEASATSFLLWLIRRAVLLNERRSLRKAE